jgi:hypothetical protein|tara:strand:- start:5485 stop:5589 length:105 start_codon:yes stop_codon:yes gene_type:complete
MKEILGLIAVVGIGAVIYTQYNDFKSKKPLKIIK